MEICLKGHQVAIIDPDDLSLNPVSDPLVLSDYGSPPRPPGQDGSQNRRVLADEPLIRLQLSTRSRSPLRFAPESVAFHPQ